MTDNEIIKAVEDLIKQQSDGYITYLENGGKRDEGHETFLEMMGCIIEMFNRQKAEVERLEIELKAMRGAANSYKAEIERLQKHRFNKARDDLRERLGLERLNGGDENAEQVAV